VINGPEATAGSIPIPFKAIGKRDPNIPEMMMVMAEAKPIIKAIMRMLKPVVPFISKKR